MSLTVSPDLLHQAQAGQIDEGDFIRCIQNSLPYAWSVIETTATNLVQSDEPFAVNQDVPPTDEAWGQLFRLVASDAMRVAVEKRFNMRLAFQNCCKVGLFRNDAVREYEEFTSARAQILNQKPELINC